jgi:hypothetical protein
VLRNRLRRGGGVVRSQGGTRFAAAAGRHCATVGGTSEVAEVLGISQATVKAHLHRVFEKTGTERQADLVKLVAGYCALP